MQWFVAQESPGRALVLPASFQLASGAVLATVPVLAAERLLDRRPKR